MSLKFTLIQFQYSKSGWNTFEPRMVSFLHSQPKRGGFSIVRDSFNIQNYKNIAWVEYNLIVKELGKDTYYKSFTSEYRYLFKETSGWKIVFQESLSPKMFVLAQTF